MAWLRRSGGGAPAASAAPAADVTAAGPPTEIEHSARGFEQALERLPRPRGRVLDLGPALASNIAFFNRLGARLRVADLEGESSVTRGRAQAFSRVFVSSLTMMTSA